MKDVALFPDFKVKFYPQKNYFIRFKKMPLNMVKSAFYFSLSRYLNFVLTFCSYRQNGLIRKIRLISKFMTSQPN